MTNKIFAEILKENGLTLPHNWENEAEIRAKFVELLREIYNLPQSEFDYLYSTVI